jgi:hypothetical protein
MLAIMRAQCSRLLSRVARVVVFAAALGAPAVAFAQAAPSPSLRRSPPVWLGLLIMFVLLAVVLGISLLPSKRGHQD